MTDLRLNGQATSPPIVILTGAGISAESGLGTFRDEGGIWSQYDLEDVATPEGFARDPVLVHDFYNARRQNLMEAAPNPAHAALARLQQARPGLSLIVTQNVDDLHERAGADSVLHMHGELLKAHCGYCGATRDCREDIGLDTRCGGCSATGGMRPSVVWFGEIPMEMERIDDALSAAALFVSIGTSGQVYPAAGFVEQARLYGARTLELNMERTSPSFHDSLTGPASEIVPAWVEEILAVTEG